MTTNIPLTDSTVRCSVCHIEAYGAQQIEQHQLLMAHAGTVEQRIYCGPCESYDSRRSRCTDCVWTAQEDCPECGSSAPSDHADDCLSAPCVHAVPMNACAVCST